MKFRLQRVALEIGFQWIMIIILKLEQNGSQVPRCVQGRSVLISKITSMRRFLSALKFIEHFVLVPSSRSPSPSLLPFMLRSERWWTHPRTQQSTNAAIHRRIQPPFVVPIDGQERRPAGHRSVYHRTNRIFITFQSCNLTSVHSVSNWRIAQTLETHRFGTSFHSDQIGEKRN